MRSEPLQSVSLLCSFLLISAWSLASNYTHQKSVRTMPQRLIVLTLFWCVGKLLFLSGF